MLTTHLFLVFGLTQALLFGTLNSIRRNHGRGAVLFFSFCVVFAFACDVLTFLRPPFPNDSLFNHVNVRDTGPLLLLILLLGGTETFAMVMIGRECLLLLRKRRSTLQSNP